MSRATDSDPSDSRPDVRERLADGPNLAPDQVVDLACADMIVRWRAGERVPAEAYATLHPALQSDEGLFDLIHMEWNLRLEIGEPATTAEFLWRFPRYAQRIMAQTSLDDFIAETQNQEQEQAQQASTRVDHSDLLKTIPADRESDDREGAGWPTPSGYAIEAEIGRGGMGIVFRARETRLKRVVALKMILADSHASPEMIARFLAEAQIIAQLRHPGIVQIHAVGEHEKLPFLELEYLSGGSLAARLDGTPWPARRAATLIESMARGVEEAHRVGVIHRDLKPANILMADDETPKVADFGIAKWLGGDPGLTHTQSIIGSPCYMAPEQADGRSQEVGPTSDVYALGAIFYELLTGRPPFKTSSVLLTLEQVKGADPLPPSRLQPGLPRDAETICLKCLEKAPSRRYPTARALAEDLRRFTSREPILARPTPAWEKVGRWCQRSPMIAALSLALVVTMAGGFGGILYKWRDAAIQHQAALRFGRQAKKSEDEARRTLDASRQFSADLVLDRALLKASGGDVAGGLSLMMECLRIAPASAHGFQQMIRRNLSGWREHLNKTERIHIYKSEVASVAFSPDGSAYLTGCGDGTAQFHETATGSVLWQPHRFDSTVDCLAFSPDGQVVLIGGGRTAQLFKATTGQPIGRPMTHPGRVHRGAFRPDGKTIVTTYIGPTALLWDAATGEPSGRPLTLKQADASIFCANFSPDGQSILGGLRPTRGWFHASEVAVWNAEGGPPTGQSIPHPAGVTVVSFSRDGRTLLTAGGDGRVRLFDAAQLQPIRDFQADPRLVETAVFSPDGHQVVTSGVVEGLARWWNTADGRSLDSPLRHQSSIWGLAFSPDGRQILTGSADKTARLWEVARDLEPSPIDTTMPSALRIAEFSPDGARSLTIGPDNVPRLRETATGQVTTPTQAQIQTQTGTDEPPAILAAAFNHDGRQLALAVATPPRKFAIQIWNVPWRLETILPQEASIDTMTFSPDGQRLAAADARGMVLLWDLALKSLVGTPLKTNGGLLNLSFHPDGHSIAASTSNGPMAIHWNFLAGKSIGQPLPRTVGRARVEFSPDGRYLLTSTAQTARLWTAATGEPFGRPIPLTEMEIDATFAPAPGGQAILTRGGDGEVCLWDPAKGQPLVPRMRHPAPVTAIAIDATSRFIVAGYGDGIAQLWDVDWSAGTRATGRPIGPPLRHTARVAAVSFLPDGNGFATIAANGETRVAPIPGPMPGDPGFLTLRLEVETAYRVDVEKSVVPILPELWLEDHRRLDTLMKPKRNGKGSPP